MKMMHMDEDIQDGFAFAIPDLYKTSSLAHFDDAASVIVDLQPLRAFKEPQIEFCFDKEVRSEFLDIPTFEYGPVEDVGVLEDSSVASLESLDPPEIVEEDVWTSLQLSKGHTKDTNLKSWEGFCGQNSAKGPSNLFLSEAGPQSYDAALIKSVAKPDHGSLASSTGNVVQSQALRASLILLALGRESIVYYHKEEERSFRPRISNVRMSGYSLQTFGSLTERLRGLGNSFLDLRNFILETQKSSTACRAYFALAGAFIPILGSLESDIASPTTPICSLLQLQALVERPGQVLQCLSEVASTIRGTRTDEQLLSRLFDLVRTFEHSPAWMLQTLQGLLVSASRPWLNSIENWLGLQHKTYFGSLASFPAFITTRKIDAGGNVRNCNGTNDFEFGSSSVPSFISTEDAEAIFETGKSLRLLESHQPNHPLTRQSRFVEADSMKLNWQFTWGDVEMIAAKANAYESNLRKALGNFSSTSPVTSQGALEGQQIESDDGASTDHNKQSAQSFIKSSTVLFEKALPDINTVQSSGISLNKLGNSSTFAPPMSLLSTLSFKPITSACARLINQASLRLLFRTYHLRTHISLLHRFVLMSDGVFASRLSQALFSSRLSTTEWHPGRPRSGPSGLKLGYRDAWPPASSELRLALTGIIADSYFNSTLRPLERSLYSTDLPGDISFAVRSMSSDELKKCSDPDALFALDFLRIQYTPVAPLDSIITPISLEKYDSIFKLLLRCSRMLFVVAQLNFSLNRSSAHDGAAHYRRRQHYAAFRSESRHFVSTVCNHFFSNVSSHWQHLDQKLETLESTATSDSDQTKGARDIDKETESFSSIPNLRTFHEHLLDNMMLALLLRKRHEQIMALLEEIWGLVLRFARLVTRNDDGGAHPHPHPGSEARDCSKDTMEDKTDAEIGDLHSQFRRKARVFVEVCRGLSDRTQRDREMAGVGLGMEQLVLLFDMNGFYTRL